MAEITFEEVVKLVDQLKPEDKQALIAHLQEQAKTRKLTHEEWRTLFESIVIDTPVIGDISSRREDW